MSCVFFLILIGYWQIQKTKLHIYSAYIIKVNILYKQQIGTDNLNLIINKSNYVFKNLFRAKVPLWENAALNAPSDSSLTGQRGDTRSVMQLCTIGKPIFLFLPNTRCVCTDKTLNALWVSTKVLHFLLIYNIFSYTDFQIPISRSIATIILLTKYFTIFI